MWSYIVLILAPLYAIFGYLKTGCIMKPGSSDQCGDDAKPLLIAYLGFFLVGIFFFTKKFLKRRKLAKDQEKKN